MQQCKNLKELIKNFSDEQKCIDLLVQMRWNGSPVCPYCTCERWYRIENGKRFKCANKECHKKYSVTVNSIFHASNIPLTTWFPALYLVTSHKKGISSCQLAKDLGVTQKTAWFMNHRIREALANQESSFLKNIVEIDEVYIGGSFKNMSNKKRKQLKENPTGHYNNKIMVMGMIERGGELRLQVAGNEGKENLPAIIHQNVSKNADLITDGEMAYVPVGLDYNSHNTVNHSAGEYVRDGYIHTNTIEGSFGLFRRMIIGTYHKLSPKHLSRYTEEMQYRYNTRKMKEGERFENALGKMGTRLSWKDLTKGNGLIAKAIIEPVIPPITIGVRGRKKPINQISKGVVIATYESTVEANKITGIRASAISKVLTKVKKSAGGFQWEYSVI